MMESIGYYILRFLARSFGSLPLKALYRVGGGISWVAEHLIRYRREVILINLSRSFPELKYSQLEAVAHEFYIRFGEILAETVWMAGNYNVNTERFKSSGIVTLTNPEVIDRLYKETPSVMLMAGHVCNWELASGFGLFELDGAPMSFDEAQIYAVYKALSNQAMDRLMREVRTDVMRCPDGQSHMLESMQFVRYVATHRGEHLVYYVDGDQHPYKGAAREEVEFMHQSTKTMTATFRLAAKYGMSLVYLRMRRLSQGHYEYTIVPIAEDASQMSVRDMIGKYYQLMQEDLQADPACYLWSHKRWK